MSLFSRDGCYVEPYTGSTATESAGLLTLMIARPVNLTQGTNCTLLAIKHAPQSVISE